MKLLARFLFVAFVVFSQLLSAEEGEKKKNETIIESARAFRQHLADVFVSSDLNQLNAVLHPDVFMKISGTDPFVGKDALNGFYAFFFATFRVISAEIPENEDGSWYVSEDGKVVVTTFHQIIKLDLQATTEVEQIELDIDVTQTYERVSNNRWLLTQEHNATRAPLL